MADTGPQPDPDDPIPPAQDFLLRAVTAARGRVPEALKLITFTVEASALPGRSGAVVDIVVVPDAEPSRLVRAAALLTDKSGVYAVIVEPLPGPDAPQPQDEWLDALPEYLARSGNILTRFPTPAGRLLAERATDPGSHPDAIDAFLTAAVKVARGAVPALRARDLPRRRALRPGAGPRADAYVLDLVTDLSGERAVRVAVLSHEPPGVYTVSVGHVRLPDAGWWRAAPVATVITSDPDCLAVRIAEHARHLPATHPCQSRSAAGARLRDDPDGRRRGPTRVARVRAYGWAAALAAVGVWAFVGAFTRALPWPLSVLFGWSAAVAFVACGHEVKLARTRNRREAERAPIPDGIATTNGIVLTHPAELCEPPCPAHAPSGHHMNDWPLNWRDDRRLWERICQHGVGHPDPDDIAYKKRHWRNPDDAAAQTIHACCGCCSATNGSPS